MRKMLDLHLAVGAGVLLGALSTFASAANFSIPAQPLHSALKIWSDQSGQQIFATRTITENKTSHAVNGEFDDAEALQQLLRDSLLNYKVLPGELFVITEQATISARAHDEDSYGLEEVLITARRRSENIQNTPIAVSAFTHEKLQRYGFDELNDIAHSVPNLTFVPSPPISGNSSASAVFLRGIGQLDFTINVDPGVGTYVDGVYLARSVGSNLDLLDLERIEVLRGPQGTLFGRNTTGGAVRLISKTPEKQASADIALTLGSDRRSDLKVVLNQPINEQLYTKVSLLSRNRDGYVTDGSGADLGDDDSNSLRWQWLWQPDDNFDARLIFDWNRDRENGSPNTPLNLFSRGQVPDRINLAPYGEAKLAGCRPETLNSSLACFGPAWLQHSRSKTASEFPARSDNDVYGTSLTLTKTSPWGTLKSITAWRELESDFQRDSDHTPFQLFATINQQQQRQFSQEFQILGNSADEQRRWVAGLYYFKESADELTQVFLPDSQGRLTQGQFDNDAENSNRAIYGEMTIDLSEKLHLTLGGRYTAERKRYASFQYFSDANTPDTPTEILVNEPGTTQRFEEFTSRLTVSMDLSERTTAYATYSEGFKSGGFNARHLGQSPDLEAVPYEPEYVRQFEGGLKYTHPNQKIRLNAAAFNSRYKDIQISTNPDFTHNATITQNAAEAEISGVETEFTLIPIQAWRIEGHISYLNARYQHLDDDVSIASSNEFAWIPEWSASIATSYTWTFDNNARLMAQISGSYRSGTEGTAENEADVRQDSYALANSNISYWSPADIWSLSMSVENITDQHYLLSANQNRAIGYAEGVYDRGRRWNLKIARHF
tara:strand:- start:16839 stop:19343 length:2505 start_codon:yes stop_codon:yes gene_type:complete